MVPRIYNRVLDIIMNKFSEKTFSVCIMNNITGFVHQDLKTGVSFHYLIPENLCHAYGPSVAFHSKPQFSAGAIMAVFDEISTYSTSLKDQRLRPGQSVHLSTEVLKPVHAGDKVTVLTKADKLGKTMGYCSMELLNEQGELVARGKHIRHLQSDKVFSILCHPLILPWTMRIHERFFARKDFIRFTGNGQEMFRLPAGWPSLEGVGRVFDVLGLQEVPYSSVLVDVAEEDMLESADNKQFTSQHGRVAREHVKAFKMTVRPITSNLLGNMHGGALACAVEHACVLARAAGSTLHGGADGGHLESNDSAGMGCYVDSVDVRYIAGMKGDLYITVAEDVHSLPLDDANTETGASRAMSRSFGKVLSAEDGALCAEYVCTWRAV